MTLTRCPACQTELAPGLLACPACHALIHAEDLRRLAAQAEAATAAGNPTAAMASWNDALALLPPNAKQHAIIVDRVRALEQTAPASAGAPKGNWLQRSWGAVVAGLVFVVTKGKLLVTGLLKAPTLFSMLASLGVYWGIFGWKFALGLIITTYIHEMGHVAALVRFGVRASPPMFVPGFGAYVRLQQHLPTVGQDARVGLAGPIWGLAAGLACYGIGQALDSRSWLAVAQFTGFINLFNLIPFWELDGGRAFRALSRGERWVATVIVVLTWYLRHEGLLIILAIAALLQALNRNAPREPDNGVLALYAGLVVVLSWLTAIPVSILR